MCSCETDSPVLYVFNIIKPKIPHFTGGTNDVVKTFLTWRGKWFRNTIFTSENEINVKEVRQLIDNNQEGFGSEALLSSVLYSRSERLTNLLSRPKSDSVISTPDQSGGKK